MSSQNNIQLDLDSSNPNKPNIVFILVDEIHELENKINSIN